MAISELPQRPIKPQLEEFDLSQGDINSLLDFQHQCKKLSRLLLWILLIVTVTISVFLIFKVQHSAGGIILISLISALLVFSMIPAGIKFAFKQDLSELVFNIIRNKKYKLLDYKYKLFSSSLAEYAAKNRVFEDIVRRGVWQYWLSLGPIELKNAVGDLFNDLGYSVRKTGYSRDRGVDLYLEKDDKQIVAQCKTWKKPVGSNIARELYGVMMAEGAHEAILVAPYGFSQAAFSFCNGKPIKLLDIDDLTKMYFYFENYVPYRTSNLFMNASSVHELTAEIRKQIYGRSQYRRRYR